MGGCISKHPKKQRVRVLGSPDDDTHVQDNPAVVAAAAAPPPKGVVSERVEKFSQIPQQDAQVELSRSTKPSLVIARVPNAHCAVCGKEVMPLEALMHKSGTYHKSCARCTKCGRQLTGGEQFIREYTNLYCNIPGRQCRNALDVRSSRTSSLPGGGSDDNYNGNSSPVVSGIVEGAIAGQRTTVFEHEKVDVTEVLAVHGDEFEQTVSAMIPKCVICGGMFESGQEVIQVGLERTHGDCKTAGKPMHQPSVSPKQAAVALPQLITLRVTCCDTKKMTFFFVVEDNTTTTIATTTSNINNSNALTTPVHIKYNPDPKSYEPASRKITNIFANNSTASNITTTITNNNDHTINNNENEKYNNDINKNNSNNNNKNGINENDINNDVDSNKSFNSNTNNTNNANTTNTRKSINHNNDFSNNNNNNESASNNTLEQLRFSIEAMGNATGAEFGRANATVSWTNENGDTNKNSKCAIVTAILQHNKYNLPHVMHVQFELHDATSASTTDKGSNEDASVTITAVSAQVIISPKQ